jgi:nitroreductase
MDQHKPVLGIPDDLDVIGILPFGYPAQPTGKGKKTRKPPAEIAHRERFGEPFEL